MATDHYREAEQLLHDITRTAYSHDEAMERIARAQAHATLALAARSERQETPADTEAHDLTDTVQEGEIPNPYRFR